MGIFEKFKENKQVGVLTIIVILLGLFLRFNDYGWPSYHPDAESYIFPALLWFYPHNYYPGLSGSGEPALGYFFVGLGCLASGEDFSRATEVIPNFYPGRELLIGKEVVNAEAYCHTPIYIMGLLFFIVVIIFALVLLDIYSATYFISFFAFYMPVLESSRLITQNIFVYFFSILGLLFLWKAYTLQKAEKKELIFFVLSSISFAAAFSSKLPAAACIVFFMFILLEKYKDEVLFILNTFLKNLDINLLSKHKEALNLKSLIKISFASILSFASVLFVAFEFSFINIFRVINHYNTLFGEHNSIGLDLAHTYRALSNFFYSINFLDVLIFFFSGYIFIRILFQKEKSKLEKFILYQTCFLIILGLFFQVLDMLRVFIIFFFGLILLMSLTFSNHKYSLNKLLGLNKQKLFFILMTIYIAFSFYAALSESPYFHPTNTVLCMLTKNVDQCKKHYGDDKLTANFLASLLKEDETFIPSGAFLSYYIRREDGLLFYLFRQNVLSHFGREPTLEEYVNYYHPMNRTLRYVLVSPYNKAPSSLNLGLDYEPNYRLKIHGKDFYWIYDVQNLTGGKPQSKLPAF